MQLPRFTRKRQFTAEQSLKSGRLRIYTGGSETLDYDPEVAPEQYPTTPKERTEVEKTRPLWFGWSNG